MKTYQEKKENARRLAQNCKQICAEMPQIYGEVAEFAEIFTKLGKKYGLLKEFRENGII